MYEKLRIRLTRNGQTVRVRTVTDDGVLLEADGDSGPRPATIEFYAIAEATRVRLRWLRERYGWPTVRWNVAAEDGCLALRGMVSDGLPPGYYRFRLRISELKLPADLQSIHVTENQATEVQLEVGGDLPVTLTCTPASFDPEVRRLVQSPDSRLDARSVGDWLADPATNSERKACVLNLLAKLRSVPSVEAPLITDVQSIFFAAFERMYVVVGRPFFDRLFALAGDRQRSFYYEGAPVSSTHARLIDELIEDHREPEGAEFVLESFREQGTSCMQAVVALPRGTVAGQSGRCYADLDIDLGNPLQDVEGLLIHAGELVDPLGLTDHIALRAALAGQPAGPFLYSPVGAAAPA